MKYDLRVEQNTETPITKCRHGVYDPDGYGASCGLCNPPPIKVKGFAPKLERRLRYEARFKW